MPQRKWYGMPGAVALPCATWREAVVVVRCKVRQRMYAGTARTLRQHAVLPALRSIFPARFAKSVHLYHHSADP
jgi:hypothetical protein